MHESDLTEDLFAHTMQHAREANARRVARVRVVILGVGNVLFGDDGFGPEVVECLTRHYHIPDDVYLMDVGTGARKLLFTITIGESRPEEIVIVDAVDWGQGLGRVFEIPVEALPTTKVDDFSLHQVPTSKYAARTAG